MTRPPLERLPSDAHSSLDDSSYDILTDSSLLSDDEAHTESLASCSVDEHNASDVSSINSESDDEADGLQNSEEGGLSQAGTAASFLQPENTIVDSGMTVRTVQSSDSANYLEFSEDLESGPATGEMHLVHCIHSISMEQVPRELAGYGSSRVGVSVYQTISESTFKCEGRFRILFVGQYNHYARPQVIAHLASALNAGHATEDEGSVESSGVTVMRLSWPSETKGMSQTPVSSSPDVDIVVDRCNGAVEAENIELTVNETTRIQISGGQAFELSDDSPVLYPTWNLVVFLHPSPAEVPMHEADAHDNYFRLVRHAMQSCNIPMLDISEYPLFQAAPMSYTYRKRSLHLLVTCKDDRPFVTRVEELLPVDLDTFLSIDPNLLNRHLASIIQGSSTSPLSSQHIPAAKEDTTSHRSGLLSLGKDAIRHSSKACKARYLALSVRETIGVLGLLALLLSGIGWNLTMQHFGGKSTDHGVMKCEDFITEPFSILPPPSTTSRSLTSSAAPIPLETEIRPKPEVAIVPEQKSLGKVLTDFVTPLDPSPGMFQVEKLNATHLSLVPEPPMKIKKGHQLSVLVSRDSEPVKMDLTPSNDTFAYIVTLPREEAYGQVDVTVRWMANRARSEQVAHFDLGSRWFKAAAWSRTACDIGKAIQSDLVLVQSSAKDISVRVSSNIHDTVGFLHRSVKEQAADAKAPADKGRKRYTPISKRIGLSARTIREAARRPFIGMYETLRSTGPHFVPTQPVAKSEPLKRASHNARDLWDKLKARGKEGIRPVAIV
ncbi:hypothetical protein EJ06DRAFT_130385 [Trichodelitschia bisporula]|uniref:Uncharacterized protein n=1 Tax=Trichodelitschia bisporula TaxID=703511 RepID=A0A6G1HPH6_9PEZI|nr:hypothetical protein EJ06DRAFT_130385 [Trichodelitschia bisporula]